MTDVARMQCIRYRPCFGRPPRYLKELAAREVEERVNERASVILRIKSRDSFSALRAWPSSYSGHLS